MSQRINAIETRILYALAFLAIGYALGVCYPAVEKWPPLGGQLVDVVEGKKTGN